MNILNIDFNETCDIWERIDLFYFDCETSSWEQDGYWKGTQIPIIPGGENIGAIQCSDCKEWNHLFIKQNILQCECDTNILINKIMDDITVIFKY